MRQEGCGGRLGGRSGERRKWIRRRRSDSTSGWTSGPRRLHRFLGSASTPFGSRPVENGRPSLFDDPLRTDPAGLGVSLGCPGAHRRTSSSMAEGPFMALDGHAQGRQEPLGRVEVHDDPLIGFDVLAACCEGLRIEAEVEDDFLGGCRDAAEIGIGRKRAGIVDDDFGRPDLAGSAGGSVG